MLSIKDKIIAKDCVLEFLVLLHLTGTVWCGNLYKMKVWVHEIQCSAVFCYGMRHHT